MRKLLFLMILLVLVIPVTAQDEEATEEATVSIDYDCTTAGINRQADAWYNEYLGARGEFETEQAIGAAQDLADNLADLATACSIEANAEPEEVVPQTGLGTIDAPYIIQAPGVVGDTTIDITQSMLPANDFLVEEEVPGSDIVLDGEEYFLLSLTVTCRAGATNGCLISDNAFRVIGDMGVLYPPVLTQIDDYFPGPVPMIAGTERSGVLPFSVNTDDTSLRLVYFPNGDGHEVNSLAYYFNAQGSANTFDVSPTTSELLIRARPVNGSPVGALRGGQVAQADGRNADGTWIHVIAPEATGWVSAEFLESDSNLDALSVIDEE